MRGSTTANSLPEPEPLLAAYTWPRCSSTRLLKRERPLDKLRGQIDAIVCKGKNDLSVAQFQAQDDFPAGPGVFDCVVQQVGA